MPADMQIEIAKISGGGDATPHMAMVDWAERSESKAILGQTMSAETKPPASARGNAQLHREVRETSLPPMRARLQQQLHAISSIRCSR
ncbi:DUF935 family protein [Rhodocyclaceae bacterium Wk13]|uniref:DUF935 family protein n=1 Tax=Dentiradicibacter hellwigii TaxID=3149053 RepID=A0ABV4UJ89_9RHOO